MYLLCKIKISIIVFLIFYANCTKITDPISDGHESASMLLTYTKAKIDSFLHVDGVWIAGPDMNPHKIIDGSWKPAFSHDGKFIAYYKLDIEENQSFVNLYIYNLIKSSNRKLTTIFINGYASYLLSPIKWSYDNTKLMYSAEKSGNSEEADIYVFNITNNIEKKITNTNHSIRPVWSYDDNKIACWTLVNNQVFETATMNSDGSNYLLINLNVVVSLPRWLPDGRIITGVKPYGKPADYEDIIIMNTDGSGLIHLTDDHNSFFVDIFDNDHIIVSNYTGSDSLYFDILNFTDNSRQNWFKMEGNYSFKISNKRNWIAYLKTGDPFSTTSSLYLKILNTNDDHFLDSQVLYNNLSWSD